MSGKRIAFRQRVILQDHIESKSYSSVTELAKLLKTSRNALYEELKKHRISRGSKQSKFLHEKPLPCQILTCFPFVCNSCPKLAKCAKEIFIYDAYEAEGIAQETRHTCNRGPSITTSELKILDVKVSPKVKCGQSLYHILQSDKSINLSEQTIRRYITNGYLSATPVDLPRTVQRKPTKKNVEKRSRIPVKILNGRMFDDYNNYLKNYPGSFAMQIDLIIGKTTDKSAVLTMFDPSTKFQAGIKVNRTAESVNRKIDKIYSSLEESKCKTFDVLLTDNGAEFMLLPTIETDESGAFRFHVFYCNPYASYQKGGCEKNHEFFRYIKKKGVSLDTITQADLNVIFSNINSYRRKSLSGSTPYQAFSSKYGLLATETFGISSIEPTNVILK